VQGADNRRISVLIVEDDEAMVAVVRAWLGVNPRIVRVDQVGTVAAASTWLVDEEPDIVVLDHALPDGTAADVLAILRERDHEAAVVLHTSHADFADLGTTLGCDAAVQKGDWAALADRLLTLAPGAR
jgi:DNA-binding NtrC family response regulator